MYTHIQQRERREIKKKKKRQQTQLAPSRTQFSEGGDGAFSVILFSSNVLFTIISLEDRVSSLFHHASGSMPHIFGAALLCQKRKVILEKISSKYP
jgi:hypothetical protein